MAIIPQMNLFSWEDIEELGDLERLHLVIRYLPDEQLVQGWENDRGKGRDDYPIRAVWNSILAGVVFQHWTIESLRRELSRNGQLRWICGFQGGKVPPSWVYSRMMKKIVKSGEAIDAMFEQLVEQLREVLPGFGKNLAIDSKAIESFANGKNRNEDPDGRRDTDAVHSKKVYRGKREDGTLWEKVVSWFGYKLHLIVDADYELPVAYSVTKASVPDINEAHDMLERISQDRPHLLEAAETLEGDRGYDDTELITKCWEDHHIKPVIDIRDMWKDGEETRLLEGYDNVVHDYKGTVYCYCPETNKKRQMISGGFEKDRMTLKKRCPAKEYGITCEGKEQCPVAQGIRIPLKTDRRIFTPIDRSSYKWQTYYNKRTSVERVNSRLAVSFGFEHHTIRGQGKMKSRCGIALCVMLAMALGHIKEGESEKMRSLVS